MLVKDNKRKICPPNDVLVLKNNNISVYENHKTIKYKYLNIDMEKIGILKLSPCH